MHDPLLLRVCVVDVISLSFLFLVSLAISGGPLVLADLIVALVFRVTGSLVKSYLHALPSTHLLGGELIICSFIYLSVRLCSALYWNDLPAQTSALFYFSALVGLVSSIVQSQLTTHLQIREEAPNVQQTTFYEPLVANESLHTHGTTTPRQEEQQHEEQIEAAAASQSSSSTMKNLAGLEALRFVAAIHLVLYHFYKDNSASSSFLWTNLCRWGGSQLSFFFILSGFCLAYQHGQHSTKLDTSKFWWRKFARLYPTYVVSILVMLFLLPRDSIDPNVVMAMLFCLQTWTGFAFTNAINTPAWFVGAILFLYLIFPASLRILSCNSSSFKTLLSTAFGFWCLCLIGTFVQLGYVVGPPFAPLYSFSFKAHFCEFLFGVSLGLAFLSRYSNSSSPRTQSLEQSLRSASEEAFTNQSSIYIRMIENFGVTSCLLLLVTAFLLIDVRALASFLFTFGANGLLSPVFGVLIWSAAADKDKLMRGVLSSALLGFGGKISYQIYVLQTLVYQLCLLARATDLFLYALLAFSAASFSCWETPMSTATNMLVQLVSEATSSSSWLCCICSYWPTASNLYALFEHSSEGTRVIIYYTAMISIIASYCIVVSLSLEGNSSFFVYDVDTSAGRAFEAAKWSVLIGFPAVFCTVCGQFGWCPWRRAQVLPLATLVSSFKNRLYWRIVTRGSNPSLVKENAIEAIKVLMGCLPQSLFVVEVVTDNSIDVRSYLVQQGLREDLVEQCFSEVHCPSDFTCSSGAKYKARALHFAILNSSAKEEDWIIHLDEETRFNRETVHHCLHHCFTQDQEVAAAAAEASSMGGSSTNAKAYGDIGQGVIIYSRSGASIENHITTLADSIRVGDDYGKFRLQYSSWHRPWIGMHGSFVVAPNAVERLIGFDNGLRGSITEDAWFALLAWAKGVRFSWIDAHCYEQSPFTIHDFIMQRRRWYGGLWIVCFDTLIPFGNRAVLLFMICTWALATLPVIVIASSVFLVSSGGITSTTVIIALLSSITCWSYILGFVKTFDIRDGIIRWFVLLFCQLLLQPLFALMEVAGVVCAIVSPPVKGFHVVKKENAALKKKTLSDQNLAAVGGDQTISVGQYTPPPTPA